MKKSASSSGFVLPVSMTVFCLLIFLLPALKSGRFADWIPGLGAAAVLLVGSLMLAPVFRADRILLNIVSFVSALSLFGVTLLRPEALPDAALLWAAGLGVMLSSSLSVRTMSGRTLLPWASCFLALLLSLIPALTSLPVRADLAAAPFFILALAGFLSTRRFLPVFLLMLICPALTGLGGHFASALCQGTVGVLMLYASAGSAVLSLTGLIGVAGLAAAGAAMLPGVSAAFLSWADVLKGASPQGLPCASSLGAVSAGGWFGVGIGQGTSLTGMAPENVFWPLLCEQFGWIAALCVFLMLILMLWRGASAASRTRTGFHGLLAMGAVAMLGCRLLLSAGGALGVLPWSGLPAPLVSRELMGMCADFCLAGFLSGVEGLNRAALREDSRLAMIAR